MTVTTAAFAGYALEELPVFDALGALGDAFVERRMPTPLPAPYLVAFNPDVASLLDLRPGEEQREAFLRLAAGNAIFRGAPSTAAPVTTCARTKPTAPACGAPCAP